MDMDRITTVARADLSWAPAGLIDGEVSLSIRGFDTAGLPVLLSTEEQARVLDAFLEATQPQAKAALAGFGLSMEMLVHLLGRCVDENGHPLRHPVDGAPIVAEAFIDAVRLLMPQHG